MLAALLGGAVGCAHLPSSHESPTVDESVVQASVHPSGENDAPPPMAVLLNPIPVPPDLSDAQPIG